MSTDGRFMLLKSIEHIFPKQNALKSMEWNAFLKKIYWVIDSSCRTQ